jgi:hypothetical protein
MAAPCATVPPLVIYWKGTFFATLESRENASTPSPVSSYSHLHPSTESITFRALVMLGELLAKQDTII